MASPKTGKKNKDTDSSFSIIRELSSVLIQEVDSHAGRFNILVDAFLAVIIIVYLLSSTVSTVARIIASIFNSALTPQTGDNIVPLIVTFLVASFLCLSFMWFTKREHSKMDNHLNRK